MSRLTIKNVDFQDFGVFFALGQQKCQYALLSNIKVHPRYPCESAGFGGFSGF